MTCGGAPIALRAVHFGPFKVINPHNKDPTMSDMIPRSPKKGDKTPDQIALSGEQYDGDPYGKMPMSDNIEDRRDPPPTEATEAETARAVASTRSRMAVQGRWRPRYNGE